jgi:hypothetical protein
VRCQHVVIVRGKRPLGYPAVVINHYTTPTNMAVATLQAPSETIDEAENMLLREWSTESDRIFDSSIRLIYEVKGPRTESEGQTSRHLHPAFS